MAQAATITEQLGNSRQLCVSADLNVCQTAEQPRGEALKTAASFKLLQLLFGSQPVMLGLVRH